MFIEIAELLRCPVEHEDTYCVLSSDEIDGRRVVSGTVGCPICKAEYPIEHGVVQFGRDPLLGRNSRSDHLTVEDMPDQEVVRALLALEIGGGYAVLIGSAARLSDQLSKVTERVQFVGVNAPPEVVETAAMSLVRSSATVPLKSGTVRGVVIGSEHAVEPWLGEAGRVLGTGNRLVVADEAVVVDGVSRLAADRGLWVGTKD